MRRWKATFCFIGAAIVAVVLVEILVLLAPGIDEQLNYLTRRSLNAVQDFRTNGRTVRDLVDARYRDARWTVFHRDYLTETYVRCDARDGGGAPVAMMWIVTWRFSVHRLHPAFKATATAHNYAAYEVAPELYQAGHTLFKSPDMANW
jgi:hypothetical protein